MSKPTPRIIHIIHGGPSIFRTTIAEQKQYARARLIMQFALGKKCQNMTFTHKDLKHACYLHDDVLVVSLTIVSCLVKRILVDIGCLIGFIPFNSKKK